MSKNLPNSPITPEIAGKKDSQGYWTIGTKHEVIWTLLATGNIRETSRKTKVPIETIRLWKEAEWWPAMVEEIKKARREELNSKLGKVVEMALDKVADRLENGDYVLNNKTGEIVRKPVNLKDASRVMNEVLVNQMKMDKANTETVVSNQSVGDMLKTLAVEFAKFNRKQENKQAIDIEFKEVNSAIHDQRTSGLQERSGEVHQSPGGSQEASGAE